MKRAIALLLLLLPVAAICQVTYQPGYFIENGKKTECLIRNYAWKNNPVSIEYKIAKTDEPRVKTIREISEFKVDAYKFKRFDVNLDRSAIVLDELTYSKEPEWKKETLLLKVLVEGKATLYQYEDGNFIKYFYSNGEHTQSEQLVYKEYKKDGGIAENNMFRQQLFLLMKDGSMDMDSFKRLKYKKDVLVKIFAEYNGMNGETVTNLSEKQNKSSLNVKITAGVSLSGMDIENAYYSDNFNYGKKTAFRVGAEFEYIMPFNNNKWSLFVEPNYQTYKKSGSIMTMGAATKVGADYKYIEVPIGFRHYMFLNPKSKFFISGAYVMAVKLGDSYVQYAGAKFAIENNSALAAGAGFTYDNRYSIEVRHNFKHGVIDSMVWSAGYNTTALILSYKVF